MNFNKSFFTLRGLNKKILLFFIIFAFIPLLVFSVLGYFINKNMLTEIAYENIHQLNIQYAKRIEKQISTSADTSKTNIINIIDSDYMDEFLGIKHEIFFINDQPFKKHKILNNNITLENLLSYYNTDNQKIPKALIHGNDGIEYFSTYSKMEAFKLVLFSFLNTDTMYADLNAFRNKIFGANIILAIILIILAMIYSRQIASPIEKLVEVVQHIRKGELDYNIEINSNDEIKILAEEFDLMRKQLQESYQGLEEKINKRTLELHEAQAQITQQEKMASLGLMAAGIAHEIGNPLTSISSMAQVIKRRIKDEKIVEFVNNILSNIDRISVIVRELVDFSRPSSLDASMISINEIINSAVGIVKYDKRSKHIYFNLELDRNIPKTYLVGDQLLQVMINILINAVDASENINNEINVCSKLIANTIKIQIEDKGSGIEKTKINRIFEPFYTTKEVGKGTGLGLTVSYGIIKKFGGEINVQSEVGKGSIFEIILPIVKEEL